MTVRRAVFRADASPAVGTGHVVRCLTLAAALVRQGWVATLATRDLPEGLATSLADAGVRLLPLGPVATPGASTCSMKLWPSNMIALAPPPTLTITG